MRSVFRILVFFSFLGCAHEPTVESIVRPYQGAGHEQFFLAELPSWANGSLSAGCARTLSIRYLEHGMLQRIHGLDFIQRVELQTQFNRKWQERYGAAVKALTPREEELLFLETLEQVRGGVRELKFPSGRVTHLVWWDQLQVRAKAAAFLEKLSREGNPIVLVSLCTDARGIDVWLESQKLGDFGISAFGAESFGPYDIDANLKYGVQAPLMAFFPFERSTLWVVGGLPPEFPVGFNLRYIEE